MTGYPGSYGQHHVYGYKFPLIEGVLWRKFLETQVNEDENEDGKYHVPHERNGGGMTGVPDTLYLQYPVDIEDDQNEAYNYSPETYSQSFTLWFSHKKSYMLPVRVS